MPDGWNNKSPAASRPADRPAPDRPDHAEVRGRLVRLAVKLLWRRDDAEDAAQEALRLAVARGVGPNDERFVPWLLRTTANLCLNRRRKRRFEPLTSWLEDAPSAKASPAEAAEHGERLARLRAAIDDLPPRQRSALVMRTMEQMSYDDIAAAMGISVAAVRTHVHFARRRLAEWLEESES